MSNMEGLTGYEAFGWGVLGPFVAYFVINRDSRIALFFRDPTSNWKSFLFDISCFLFFGGVLALLLARTCNATSAFFTGCAWQGAVSGYLAGQEKRQPDMAQFVALLTPA